MAARALLPAGYMLSPAGDGGRFVTVSLCAEHGLVEAVVDRQTGQLASGPDTGAPAGEDEQKPRQAPCVFAALAQIAVPEKPVSFPAPAALGYSAPNDELVSAEIVALAAPPPWPTGPPIAA